MKFKRKIDLQKILKTRSVLLLGPRRTGKSFYIKNELHPDFTYDLLQPAVFRELSATPEIIRQRIDENTQLISIDEIQKLPWLMDEVHSLIESTNVKFILTGSSAKKLKRTHTGLMAGRARICNLFPLTFSELGKSFDINTVLNYGSLPSIYLSDEPNEDLADYVGIYLKDEIMYEALVRKIDNFSRFLEFAAHSNGQVLNYQNIASDAEVPARTIREYYAILEDTLMGYQLNPIADKSKRKAIASSKFYFFDIGVVNSLTGRKSIQPKTKEYGDALEHFIFLELKAYQGYVNRDLTLNFWNSPREGEVDFILNQQIAIEVKSSAKISNQHMSGLSKYSSLFPTKRKIIVCLEAKKRKIGDVEIMPLVSFLNELWAGKIV